LNEPPERPGRPHEDRERGPGRGTRAAGSAAQDAYQGAFEAVMAVLVGAGLGYWVDLRWESTPIGVISGVVIGFAAMVVRLLRLGRELVPQSVPESKAGSSGDRKGEPGRVPKQAGGSARTTGAGSPTGAAVDSDDADELGESDRGPGETPGLIDIWGDDAPDERD
jgi:F0F1-type ATP synthase assembly protein I